MDRLKRYRWPGNIRELENLVERLVIMKGSGVIGQHDLPPAIRNAAAAARDLSLTPIQGTPAMHPAMAGIPQLPTDGADLRTILEAVEDRMISEALERTGGNKNKAAELLGLNRTTLVEKLRRKRLTPTMS
jgi:DNA-binding NtrC family response regulator